MSELDPVAAVARLRRMATALDAAACLAHDDREWLAAALYRYLEDASRGISLEAALGLSAVGHRAWWRAEAQQERDQLIRTLAQHFPSGSTHAVAHAVAQALRRYGSSSWPRDRRQGLPAGATTTTKLLHAIFQSDPNPPTGIGRLTDILG